MEISVVITTFNRCEVLAENLKRLNDQTFCCFETLVCDDNSIDQTKKAVENTVVRYPISYFNTNNPPEVFGACKARNMGLHNAKGNIVLFIDDDILLHNQAIEKHAELFHKNGLHINSIGYVSGSIKELDVKQLPIIPTNPKWKARVKRIEYNIDFRQPWKRGSCVNTAYSKEDLIAVGGWDEKFNRYGYEEKDLNFRLFKERKIKFLLNLEAVSVHVKAPGLSKEEKKKEASQMAKLLYNKHPEIKKK